MKNRYKKLVYEDERGITFEVCAKEGITLEVSEGTSGEIIIKAQQIATVQVANDVYSTLPAISAGEYSEELSVYTDKDGNQAVIPPGWVVSGLPQENTIWGKDVSLVIYQIPWVRKVNWENPKEVENVKMVYSQLVWCPVSLLDANGTLDGKHFTEKFGRRNYRNNVFSNAEFHESLEGELLEQFESVKKYGGFYISRYNISKASAGNPQSIKGEIPWTKVSFYDAKKVAADFENDEALKSHLTYGAEYDSVLAWLIKSDAKTFKQIAKDSTEWGNHWNHKASPKKVVENGSCEKWCANNIYDFAGNVDEWTQEKYEESYCVIRGGDFGNHGRNYPVAHRNCSNPNSYYSITSFRVTLYIK